MNTDPRFSIRVAHWTAEQSHMKQVRKTVFVQEQQVPLELEWDGKDAEALHMLALDENQKPIGTVRLLPSGQIGRMAVLRPWRNQGVGQALLDGLLAQAAKGHYPRLFLNAQLTARPFYAKRGFIAEGDEFMEAGIPHQRMLWQPADNKRARAMPPALLGETGTSFYLHSLAEVRELSTRMVSQARRKVVIFTQDLDPAVYARADFVRALKQLALNTRVAQIRILLQDNGLIRSQGHRLVGLAQRLSSSMEIRKPGQAYRDFSESFLLVDDCGCLHRKQTGRYTATACFNDRLKTLHLQERFDEAWESGEPDMELLRLHL